MWICLTLQLFKTHRQILDGSLSCSLCSPVHVIFSSRTMGLYRESIDFRVKIDLYDENRELCTSIKSWMTFIEVNIHRIKTQYHVR